ncbi:hypothetical protein NDU88_002649 [Pleurodeles waltl]|uniref:Uncharacterized protein n=1 Tax=Pleurodeles waltl TaxID=8319 RepID=A0AAV7W3Y0_PLEWA|nr:hypothetical protein NDU88_002649 [Pleurodeles waltl]
MWHGRSGSTVTPRPQSSQDSPAPALIEISESLVNPTAQFSPVSTQDKESGVQALESVQAPQEEQRFPTFLTPGADPSAFLNAMFSIFNRAMAPAAATAGPTGLLDLTLGSLVPYKQALFVPFYQGEGAGSAPMTSPPRMMLLTAPMGSMLVPDRSR